MGISMMTRMEEEFARKWQMGAVRLNKYLSEAGVCSRREADRMIEEGRILVDGMVAVPGMKVEDGQQVLVDGKPVEREKEMILLAFYKPVGVVCTTDRRWGDTTVEEFLHFPKRVFSMGRLDKNSEGLLLMTNHGDIQNKIMKAGNYHEKEYEVTVHKPVTGDFLEKMAAGGIPIGEQVTRSCKVEQMDQKRFRIVLTQGLNRQIRRMCEYCGYQVERLIRVRIMNICLGELKPGEYRRVSPQEQEILYEKIRDSKNEISYERN